MQYTQSGNTFFITAIFTSEIFIREVLVIREFHYRAFDDLSIYRLVHLQISGHGYTEIFLSLFLSLFLSFSLLVSKHVCQFKLVVAPLTRSIFFSFRQPFIFLNKPRLVVSFLKLLANCFEVSLDRPLLFSYEWFNVVIIVGNYFITNSFVYSSGNCVDNYGARSIP